MTTHPRALTALIALATAALATAAATVAAAAGPSINAAPQAGIVWERGLQHAAGHGKHTSSPNLTYHGGAIMTGTTQVFPIFWGTSWGSYTDETGGIETLYAGFDKNAYTDTNTEYQDSSGAFVSDRIADNAPTFDPTAAISHAPQTSDILAEVGRMFPNPTPNAYYPVYVDQPRGHARYCAWHSTGTVNGVSVQIGFFFKLDGDPGCDPQASGTGHTQGLDALANVTGHELSEMLTDPQLDAWYDSQGAENADKCAWTFGARLLSIGGQKWKIQGNWSNHAYTAGTGYFDPSSGSVVQGCIDGTN